MKLFRELIQLYYRRWLVLTQEKNWVNFDRNGLRLVGTKKGCNRKSTFGNGFRTEEVHICIERL